MICTVKVSELVGNGDTQCREIEIATFAELVAFFDEIYADFLSQLGEEPYGPPPLDKSSGEIIGGFGVRCTNVFGSEIEVGVGRDWWLLIDLTADGSTFFVDDRPPKHDFIFYLDGWHYTGIGSKDVIARDKCLAAIEKWVDGRPLEREA